MSEAAGEGRQGVTVDSRLPLGLLTVAVLITGLALTWMMWEAIDSLKTARSTAQRDAQIEELRSVIVHLDEVLTMSALMAVATGDQYWVDRYHDHAPELEAAIKKAQEIAPKAYIGEGATQTENANKKLVSMEKRAFGFLEQKQSKAARELLFSDDYEKEKRSYAQGMTRFARTLRSNLRLEQLRGVIVHLDEVLTMSARMAAETGDDKWIDRYRQNLPQLEAAIEEAKALAPKAFTRDAVSQTDEANIELVDMENQAFALVGEQRLDEARQLLSSDEYVKWKRVYAQGMKLLAGQLKSIASEDLQVAKNTALQNAVATIMVIPVLMIGWLFVLRSTRQRQAALVESNRVLGAQATQLAELNRAMETEVAERKRAELLQRGRSRALERLAAGAPLEQVLSILVETAEAVEPQMICSILLLDDETNLLRHCAAPSLPDFFNEALDGLEIGRGVGSSGEAAASGERVIIEDVLTHPNWAPFRDLAKRAGVRGAWSVPVVSSTGGTLGTFAMYYREPRRPSPRQIELIESGAQLAAIAIDYITERVQVDQALRESEEKFRAVAQTAADGIISADADGNITYFNTAAESLFGYTAAEVIGRSLMFLMPDRFRTAHAQGMRRLSSTGEARLLGKTSELAGRRKDGSEFPLDLSSATWKTGDGQTAFTGILRDITDRKRAEERLRESEARFRSIFEHAGAGMHTVGPDGHYRQVNQEFCTMLGYSEQELLKLSVADVTHPDDLEATRRHFDRMRAGKDRFDLVKRLVRRDGATIWVHVTAAWLTGPDQQPLYGVALVQDITKRKQVEEELAKHRQHLETLVEERTTELKASHARLRDADRLASIGTLTAGLGHDMSNVLLPLRLRLDALDWRTVPSDLKELIEAIHHAVDYLHQMCVGLRSLAIGSPEGDVPSELTTLTEWWIDAEPLLRAVLPEAVRLESDLPGGVPPVGVAPHRLTQAVLNLTVNAGEAMPDGGCLRLWAAADEDDGFVKIGITDEGVGMTEKVQLQVLDPFFTTKTRGLSTGLGLALVHGVVASSGGTMYIDSEPGKGTTVVLKLPIADPRGPDRGTAPEARVRAVVSLMDPQTTAWVSILLTAAGFDVHRTENAESDGSRLWVTEPTPENLQAAKRYCSGRPDRRIIVLGPADRAWTDLGAIVIEESKDLEAIRSALREMPPIRGGEDR